MSHSVNRPSLVYGENSLIYCTAIEPRNPREWSSLRASFEEEGYDHYSPIYDPHMFAQTLASMAFREKGLLGNPITFRHPHRLDMSPSVATCP